MRDLQDAIQAAVPGAEVVGKVGRRTSYEVVVDGTIIHSKLETKKFPDREATVEIIKNVAQGGKPEKVAKMSTTCTIL